MTNLFTTLIFPGNQVFAQITPDNTLPNNSRITTQNNIKLIEGGTQAGNNLFHSFEQFSIPTANTAYFNNSPSIQNIITRVTGTSISNIEGTIRANGIANLFLINPNGIVFGEQASLNIGGSFIASTANSVNFADGSKFGTTTTPTPALLTISTPIGLQFGQSPGSIINKSQGSLNRIKNSLGIFPGLQVSPGKTLALIGGDIKMDGGNLTAPQGRIELGSVGSDSLVSLIPTGEGWTFGYEGVGSFQNIQQLARNSDTFVPFNSILTTTGEKGNGYIRVRGDVVEIASSGIIDLNLSNNNGGDIAIDANKLIVRDGGQIVNSTIAAGTGGKLTINAATSVDIIGIVDFSKETSILSAIANTAYQTGNAGDITINTGRLNIRNGGTISVQSSGILIPPRFQELVPARGNAGNLTINATSIELAGKSTTNVPSSLIAETLGSGNAGKLTINTENLIVRDGAEISVSSQVDIPPNRKYLGNPRNLGRAGDLTINARSIILDSQGKIISQTDLGNGGNIIFNVQDLLLMRRNSQISTSAGKVQSSGDGGNITIQSANGFIVANQLENSDITANAYTGSGGKIKITATGIFGIEQRNREDLALILGSNDPSELDPQKAPTSDITAISQTNPSLGGTVNLNTLDIDANRGLIKLPQEPQEPKLAQGCKQKTARNQSQFTITGRGGLPVNPQESLRNHTVNADWISLENLEERSHLQHLPKNHNISTTPIMEAQGWIVNNRGEIFLVANTPKPTNQNSALVTPSCS
ncbi:filamentous hemagglutinin N-terminal domain-containing protein [Calothrix sp. UHCC 0171]|uniref:two-partner secretion domain-containing protein n=1 Tax=Calothrix sp. UHCC 0171 TaxID=3110245 RepID=UPI002B20851A|nr:filamentous hemagglutinin N-terminal domain-containing protein [Calothrix sp. UHCC 0171]MEA5570107.1 filamentous hemagglutinin N-terminal domain-containing protein [Calothrix sp. UHCC 0171]